MIWKGGAMPDNEPRPVPPGAAASPASAASIVQLDERRLLTLFAGGDAAAFAHVVLRLRASVYGYLVRCGIGAKERDDVFQDIIIKISAARASFQPDRPLKPWVFTIVANAVRSHLRRVAVDRLVFGEELQVAALPATAHHEAEARETAAFLDQAIGALPLAQREAVLLCCVEALPQPEVAAILGLPLGTLKTELHRGRLALARAMARRQATAQREVSHD
jgi:RNA polymerase sigma-70 factor (ECF subfamily)